MKTVLLLGAGASVAEAIAQGVNQKMLPPTDKSFFDYVRVHYHELFTKFENFVKDSFHLSINSPGLSSEYIFSLTLTHALEEKNTENFDLLLNMYQRAIANSTDSVQGNSPGALYSLLKYLNDQRQLCNTTLVTFNYDLLAEKSLYNLQPHAIESPIFDIKTCYQISRYQTINVGPNRSDCFRSGSLAYAFAKILKLHGSLNWFMERKNYADNSVVTSTDDNRIWVNENKRIVTEFQFKLTETDGSEKTYDMRPIIVPPVCEKQRFLCRKILDLVWKQASERIQKAESLIIFGYSLPDADKNAQEMLAGALAKNKSLDVHIIDINPDVCKRFTDGLGIDSLCYYRNADEFISKN